jgi:hypothetical protein
LICASFAARAAAKMVEQPAVPSIRGLIEYVFDAGSMDYLYEALHGPAIRYAAEKRNPAESIAELREIATGHDDILAEAAGITVGSWYASPAIHVGHELIAVGMLILAGGGAVGRLTMLSWSGGRVLVYGGGAGSANTN